MEDQERKDPQFDSYLGGSEKVPDALNLSEFIKHRMEEVVMLTEAIEESPFRGQTFQRLPKHMRRRQMSHYIKRLPRRLQRPYLMSLKDQPPTPTKRPSRKYRRRPSNLLLEYNRRQKNSVWLETHIWHAKRFHMTSKWGYKLPLKPVNKSFKACYRAISNHCLLLDLSYYNCIELKGRREELLEGLGKCTSKECGLTFAAKAFANGTREGRLTLFHPNTYPEGAIGNITFTWQQNGERIWIWVHPLLHDEIVDCFTKLFNLKAEPEKQETIEGKTVEQIKLEPRNVPFVRTPKYANETKSVSMILLKDTLNRFRVIGPLAHSVVFQALSPARVEGDDVVEVEVKKLKLDPTVEAKKKKNWWEDYYGGERRCFNEKTHSLMLECSGASDCPPGVVLGSVIEDPRLDIPAKREKALPKGTAQRSSIDPELSESPIWIPEVRDEVSATKLTTQEINDARAKNIVPGQNVKYMIPDDKQSRIPILLIQSPGTEFGKLGLGSGWDIIAPSGFGMPIWLSLIFRGARAGSLREFESLQLESNGLREILPPDSAAGERENRQNLELLKTEYFKLPPEKRPNFRKLGVVSPFYPLWNVLVKDWHAGTTGKLKVLRGLKKLQELKEMLKKGLNKSEASDWGLDWLIPVALECSGRGKPKDLALICLPEEKDFHGAEPIEPSHSDENSNERKTLKKEHCQLLKKLKRKRRKERGKLKEELGASLPDKKLTWKGIIKKNLFPSEPFVSEYKNKMEDLWLPDVEKLTEVANSCSRKILGWVVKGEFSYSKSRGLGLGYVALPGLIELLDICQRNKSMVSVLVRNKNQVQYRFAKLRICDC